MAREYSPSVLVVGVSLLVALSILSAPIQLVSAETDGPDSVHFDSSLTPGQQVPPPTQFQVDDPTEDNSTSAPEENNTSVQHRNPEDVDRDGDLEQVKAWLEGRMGTAVVDCTDGIAAGSEEVCDRMDEDYPDWLGKYVEVAEETDDGDDDAAASAFRDSRERLNNLSSETQEFRNTYREYQEATREGNDARARRLARELIESSRSINESSSLLVEDFRVISNTTEVDLRGQTTEVEEMNSNASTISQEVQSEAFVPTRLEVSIESREFSYTRPLEIAGRLRSNETAPANGTIVLVAGTDQMRTQTRTDRSGTFSLSYRPTDLSLDVDTVTVRYVPASDSIYASSEATRTVEVNQVTPTLTVDAEPTSVQFDDPVSITGQLAVDDEPVADVPIVIVAEGHRLDRLGTNETGQFDSSFALPASVPAGDRTVMASVPFENRAISGVNASTAIAIDSTPTTVTVIASEAEPGQLTVEGELATETGTSVAGQSIDIRVNGTGATTVETTESGEFDTLVPIPEDVAVGNDDGNATVVVSAIFSGDGTNLEPSRARTTITVSGTPSQESDGPFAAIIGIVETVGETMAQLFDGTVIGAIISGMAWWHWFVVLGAVAALLVAAFVFRRAVFDAVGGFGGGDQEPAGRADSASGSESATPGKIGSAIAPSPDDVDPLARSRTYLDGGDPDEAVVTAYATVRRHLQDSSDEGRALTHWEFFSAWREDGLPDEGIRALQHVTEAYERAAFDPRPIDLDDAGAALDAADELV